MSRIPALLFLTMSLFALPARADWDAKLEAEEQAKREAAAREEQARKAEADAMLAAARAKADAAMMADKRKTAGAAAAGRSDAEVNRLYDAHRAEDRRSGRRVRGGSESPQLGRRRRRDEAGHRQIDAGAAIHVRRRTRGHGRGNGGEVRRGVMRSTWGVSAQW
ncbi:MAG: hypothetical protein IPO95_05465 [Rhodanobacteraceae bacterium]|nr:hypothetical protein [Rhodanobacteraceae bacterium]